MATEVLDPSKDSKRQSEEDILEEAKRNFKRAQEATEEQREREREDLRFQIPENQWTDEAKRERQGRPQLSISLLQQPIQLVKNQAAAADLGVNIHPVSEAANDKLAEIKQGLYRRIERDSNAELVRLWAFDRACQCGLGWYRIVTQWDEDGDDPLDQEIVIKRIYDQSSIYIDPAAQEPDFSDAEWGFQVAWIPIKDFKRKYPDADVDFSDSIDFEQLSQSEPNWVKGDGDSQAVMVVEYFRKEHVFIEVKSPRGGKPRKMDKVNVISYTMTALEILEQGDLDIPYIPLVPVIGRQLQPFDEEARWEGMVRPARDGQRLVNFAASSMVERLATETKTPFIGPKFAFEGFEAKWNASNTRNFPFMEYNHLDPAGNVIPPPARAQLDTTGMSLAMMAFQEGKGYVQAATAVYDPSLGETPKRGQSGRAVIAQQQQSDAGTSNYLQSLATISLPYEAKVILAFMPKIYDRPGRVTRILGGEDEKERSVMLGKPFLMQGESPVAAPPTMRPGVQGVEEPIDLARGKYSISVSIGKSYQTRLQQGQEEFGQLLEGLPPELQVLLLPTYMKFRDTPGAKEAAELLEKFRDSKFPGLAGDEGQAQTPEQLQAQIQGMQQQQQEMGQQMQQMQQALQIDQAKQQAAIQMAQMKAQTDMELAKMDNATKIAVAQINAQSKGVLMQTEARNEAIALDEEQSFEAVEGDKERAHEVALEAMKLRRAEQQEREARAMDSDDSERDRQHESQEAQQSREHESTEADANRQQESKLTAFQAAQKAKEPKGDK